MSNIFQVLSVGGQAIAAKSFFLCMDHQAGATTALLARMEDGMDLIADTKATADEITILSIDGATPTVTAYGTASATVSTIKTNIDSLPTTSSGNNLDWEEGFLELSDYCDSDSIIVLFVQEAVSSYDATETNTVIAALQAKNQSLYVVGVEDTVWDNFGFGSWNDRFNLACTVDYGMSCLGDFIGYYDPDDMEDTDAITTSTLFN